MEEDGKWYGHIWSNWYGHVRSNRCKTGWQTELRGESLIIVGFPFTGSSELFQSLLEDIHMRLCLCTGEGSHAQHCLVDSFCQERAWCVLSPKNNCWGFVVVLVMFCSLQSLAWVVFPAIFLSYQPYNFIVIIHCGMSLDTHPSWRLCWADCLLIWWTNGFRHFLVSFCLFLLTFEIFVSKDEVHIFSL